MALTIRPADIIKARVIDLLIEKFDGIIIGDEVKYGTSRRLLICWHYIMAKIMQLR